MRARVCCLLLGAVLACRGEASRDGGGGGATPPAPGRRLEVGDVAPDFSGLSHTGFSVRLSQFLRKPVALYFCSGGLDEACTDLLVALRDQWLRYNHELGMVIAVVPNSQQENLAFASEHELPLLLVADTDRLIQRSYGVLPPVAGSPAEHVGWLIGTDRKALRAFTNPTGADHATELVSLAGELVQSRPGGAR